METYPRRLGRCAAPLFLATCAFATGLHAQAPHPGDAGTTVKVINLRNVGQQTDANEIMVALRNIVHPDVKIYLVDAENAIVIEGAPDQVALAEQLASQLDRPHKAYRLTFRIHETDGGKALPTREVQITAVTGQHTVVKQGDKVPVATGKYDEGTSGSQTQFTYLDVGLNLDVTPTEQGGSIVLRSKVELSAVANSQIGPQDPVVQQTVLEGTTPLLPGKRAVLGSLDLPGAARHTEVEVEGDPVP